MTESVFEMPASISAKCIVLQGVGVLGEDREITSPQQRGKEKAHTESCSACMCSEPSEKDKNPLRHLLRSDWLVWGHWLFLKWHNGGTESQGYLESCQCCYTLLVRLQPSQPSLLPSSSLRGAATEEGGKGLSPRLGSGRS